MQCSTLSLSFLDGFATELENCINTAAHLSRDLCLGQVVEMHQSLLSLETDSQLLRSQLHAVSQENLNQAQEVTELQRKLQDAEDKVGHGYDRLLVGP